MIDSFRGEHAFLSNFFPVTLKFKSGTYPSVEHAFQATKTHDLEKRVPFQAGTAANAKKMGRRLVLRDDWDEIKLDLMLFLVRKKFQQEHLREWLLNTGDQQLVEGNWWNDTFWGVCRGQGLNHLGKILMKVRDEIRQA